MKTFKLANHNLYDNQWDWVRDDAPKGEYKYHYVNTPIVVGTKVCTLKTLSSVGVVTEIGSEVDTFTPHPNALDQTTRVFVRQVTILWASGPKKGKTEIKDTKTLTNFDSYKAAVVAHFKEVEDYEAEAAAFLR